MRVESSLNTNEQQARLSTQTLEGTPRRTQGEIAAAKEEYKNKGQEEIAEKSIAQLLLEKCDLDFQLNFSIHKETSRLVCKVVDPDSNEVIREIPPEELLELAVRLQEMLGILFDKRI